MKGRFFAAGAVLVLALVLAVPGAGAALRVLASDTGATSSPLSFWGSIECASPSRYSFVAQGGDGHRTATGSSQGNASYRHLTLFDGDDDYGERCELGFNNLSGPTVFYHQSERRVTYFSERLPFDFPLATQHWQTVMQMKQTQPSHDANTGPALELQAYNGRWYVNGHWHNYWSFPARTGVWTRFAWNVYYSRDPNAGSFQVSADLNGDGDFEDPGERSPTFRAATLATEIGGYPRDGVAAGASIPSHLRIGIYHDSAISCPRPRGCSIDVDNVQVTG